MTSYRFADNGGLGLKPRYAGSQAMDFQTQESAQSQTDMVTLRRRRPMLSTFDATELLETTMVLFNTGLKPTLGRRGQHRLETVVFAQMVMRLVIHAKVAGQMRFAVRLQQADQVDALHHPVMLARPMPCHQLDHPRIELVQRAVIDNQQAADPRYAGLNLLPQSFRIRLTPMQQARVGVMRWTIAVCRWMTLACFSIAEHFLRGNQKVDVAEFVAFRWVYAPKYSRVMATA